MQVLRLTLVGLVAAAVLAPAAMAERTKPSIHFFSGQQSDAHWTPKDSSDANRMSIELDVGPTVGLSFAGAEFNHEEGRPAPTREPYFFHKEDRAGPSGGSPRLVIHFGGLNRMELRPDEWSTDWQRVGEGDGDGNWDVNGGTCGFLFDTDYATARSCFTGMPVQNAFFVTDSNWLYVGGYLNWIDQIQYEGFVYSHASDNNNRPAP